MKKVILVIGPPGSGKSTVSGEILIKNKDYEYINIDNSFEKKLKENGLSLDINSQDKQTLSLIQQIFSKSKKEQDKLYNKAIFQNKNFIWDTTGCYPNSLLKKIDELISKGYQVEINIIKCNLETCLKRNEKRERKLKPIVVFENWFLFNKSEVVLRKKLYDIPEVNLYVKSTDEAFKINGHNFYNIFQQFFLPNYKTHLNAEEIKEKYNIYLSKIKL